MKSSTVNISFNDELLEQIDRIARQESRSRSELLREAARAYIDRKNRWDQLFAFSEKQANRQAIRQDDVAQEIARYRGGKDTD